MSRSISKFGLVLALLTLTLPVTAQVMAQRPTLGVTLHPEGLAIESVDAGSLAAQAGLQAGDYLTHWDARPLPEIAAVLAARDAAAPGAKVKLRVLRGDGSKDLQLAIPDPKPDDGLVLGANVGNGLFVASVLPDSAAAAAGIEPGDILMSFGDHPVTDLMTLRAMLARVPWGETRALGIRRGAKLLDLKATFEAPAARLLEPGDEEPAPELEPRGNRAPRWASALLDLGEVKKEIDASIAELKELADPRVDQVVARLEAQSRKLGEVAAPMGRLRLFGNRLNEDLRDLEHFRFESVPDLHAVQKKMEELMQRHGDDIEALRRALGDEFPGMGIMVEKGGRVPQDFEVEIAPQEGAPQQGKILRKIEIVPAPAAQPEAGDGKAEKPAKSTESEHQD